ncbi:MAG: hypothetical protein M0031_08640 [Thermaerobacter sp.]|nr:hypothetical protein [Thermaerobacter sp.]
MLSAAALYGLGRWLAATGGHAPWPAALTVLVLLAVAVGGFWIWSLISRGGRTSPGWIAAESGGALVLALLAFLVAGAGAAPLVTAPSYPTTSPSVSPPGTISATVQSGTLAALRQVRTAQDPTELLPAGPGAFWVFESSRASLGADLVQRFDPSAGTLGRPVRLPGTVQAVGTNAGGAAMAAYAGPSGPMLAIVGPKGGIARYRLPAAVVRVEAIVPNPGGGFWIAYRDAAGKLGVQLDITPSRPAATLGSAGVKVAGMAATHGIAYLALSDGTLAAVRPDGRVAFQAALPSGLQPGQMAAAPGRVWIMGYAPGTGHPVHILELDPTTHRFAGLALPSTANMPTGIFASSSGTVSFGFSAVGGGHGYPGAGVLAGHQLRMGVDTAVSPGGGAGEVYPLSDGRLLVSVPFSGVLLIGTLGTAASPPTSTGPSPTAAPAVRLYLSTGAMPGELFTAPHFPTTFAVDNHDGFSHLAWRGEGGAAAYAAGVAYVDECQPDCASGQSVERPVNLLASDPQSCEIQLVNPTTGAMTSQRAYIYHQIVIRSTGSVPPPAYLLRTITLGSACRP